LLGKEVGVVIYKSVFGVALALLLAGCGTSKMAMERSDRVPAAEGQVKVNEEKDGNNKVEVKVLHLAPPERLQGSHYVVWIRPTEVQGPAQNVGVLGLDDEQSAELETTTPFDKFEVFVTVEPSDQATSPTGAKVLWSAHD
jgi:Tfp pilus assembly protein PilZ